MPAVGVAQAGGAEDAETGPATDELAAVAEVGAGDTRPSVRLAVDVFPFQYHAGGMRFGDAATLPASAIVEKPDGRAVLIYAQAKTEKVQAFILPSAAAEIARRYLDTAGPDAGPSTGLLFQLCLPSELADPIRRRQEIGRANARVNKALKEAAKLAGVPGFSTHAARHSWASQKVGAGADLRAIQKALGHSTLAMTSRYVADLGADVIDLDAL